MSRAKTGGPAADATGVCHEITLGEEESLRQLGDILCPRQRKRRSIPVKLAMGGGCGCWTGSVDAPERTAATFDQAHAQIFARIPKNP